MISTSKEYRAAITADARRTLLKAVIDIIDPDITYGTVNGSAASVTSQPEQIHNKAMGFSVPYATLEANRWLLNGGFAIVPDEPAELTEETGYVSSAVSGDDGTFAEEQFVELTFDNVSILQALSLYFPSEDFNGYPVDFTVEVKQGGTVYFTKTVTGNTAKKVSFDGFTVYDPDAIRLTVTKWSLPWRRMRIPEIIPGIYEEWDGNIIASFSVTQQGNVSDLSLPYGTCTLRMDNLDRRFEPRNKNGIFQSIEERQGIDVSIGVRLEDGSDDYKRLGIFYQYSGGWRTGDNGLTMQWDMVDIVGLLAGREFIPPSTLPTTLNGWLSALVSQLGTNFETLYHADPNYADLPVTVNDASAISGMKCGDLLRFVCMATGTWPRADAETGYLTAEPFWNQGNKLTLDNLTRYPVMKANDDIAAIIFTLSDGTQYVVSGNATSSSNTVSIKNPFLHTTAAALTAAKMILSDYGGNKLETVGRGDPSSEIGDVDTVWLNESSATTGRRIMQSFQFQNGVLQNCQSTLLQADGSFLFENREVITQSGTWTAPTGVTTLRLILVENGGDGTDGEDGTWDSAGADGVDGIGGKVWAGTININAGQTFDVSISATATVFGAYSSANGEVFPYGYTDVSSGESYGRTGVKKPLPGSGDGGIKGIGGAQGRTHEESWKDKDGFTHYDTVIDSYPGKGTAGVMGATGCVVIYWDKE